VDDQRYGFGMSEPLTTQDPWPVVRDWRGLVALSLVLCLACSGSGFGRGRSAARTSPGTVARYRLQLRHNPVDTGEAFRCYGACQPESTPKGYMNCLTACPGFEVTDGAVCDQLDVPPEAACFTVRKIPRTAEPDPGLIVLAVVGSFLLVVAASSLCASSNAQCYRGINTWPY
jgi:hypothetical protein